MNAKEIVNSRREEILEIARSYGASNVRLFGSVARGDADEASDIDLLVDFEAGRTLLDLAALVDALEAVTGCHVDIATERGLRPRIRDAVVSEAIAL